jgi:drug/metabolite transporter (DMT)-like permease
MIFLVASILISSFIFVIFKLFKKYKIDTLQAIVFNYLIAGSCGLLIYGKDLKQEAFQHPEWFPFVILSGFLFIASFLVMGFSSQRNGLAITSVAVKMSMAFSMLLMIIVYGEKITFLKIFGIILAIVGVLLMSINKKNEIIVNRKPVLWMLFFLFIGGGMLDFVLNYAQNNVMTHIPSSIFSAFGFSVAFFIGLIVLLYTFIKKTKKFKWKNLIAGIALGIPNYFSILFLITSYSELDWDDSTILAVTNISIVILSAFTGFLAFREELTVRKIIGLSTSVIAIICLYLGSL